MRSTLKFSVYFLLIGILFCLSCKKETSCEGCACKNKPPIAKAGLDQVITLPTDSVLLDGNSTSDPDGKISEWLWTKISGPVSFNIIRSSDSITKVKTLVAGTYQFELKVTDNCGLFAKDTMMIIVDAVLINNHPPIANAGADQIITLPANSVNLDGSASSDPENNITSYAWTKISGPSSFNIASVSTVQTLVTNLVQGTYQFELKVTDNGLLSARDTMQVMVNSTTNHPPIANAGNDTTIILPANIINLDGSRSTDPENNIVSYAWSKISGPSSFSIVNANAVQTQVTNLAAGIYKFELKVIDAGGLFAKDTMQVTVNIASCDPGKRQLINTQLVSIGMLSQKREGVAIAAAGNKILFAGGYNGYDLSSTVDIYDISTQSWSTAILSVPRDAIAVVTAGNKILFAGGYNGDEFNPITYSTVDIYDVSTNTWSVTSMSESVGGRSAAVLGNKIFFAGGFHCNGNPLFLADPASVDIYDLLTNTWSTSFLSEGREGLSAVAAANKIYFAGGTSITISSNKIDIYDGNNGTWSVSTIGQARGDMASIGTGNKIYWAGGTTAHSYDFPLSSTVEIRDVNSQASSFACLFQPNGDFNAVLKNNKIVFFTGRGVEKNKFDIYDITTDTWSIGVLPQNIVGASIISVNNTIYVAGGYVNGVLSNQVWKLEF